MKLCGLDFETANSCNGSICAVGAALFEDGIVLERMEHLIKPHKSMDYISSNSSAGMSLWNTISLAFLDFSSPADNGIKN